MVRVEFFRAKVSVRPHISDDVLMYVLVKGDIFEFIGLGRMKNGIVLCESRQDWFEFVAMHNTLIPHANVLDILIRITYISIRNSIKKTSKSIP